MEPKIAQFINKGMQQDYSISKASNEFAFKNHNIRITTRGDNSLLTVTNEKSNIPPTEKTIVKHSELVSKGLEPIEYWITKSDDDFVELHLYCVNAVPTEDLHFIITSMATQNPHLVTINKSNIYFKHNIFKLDIVYGDSVVIPAVYTGNDYDSNQPIYLGLILDDSFEVKEAIKNIFNFTYIDQKTNKYSRIDAYEPTEEVDGETGKWYFYLSSPEEDLGGYYQGTVLPIVIQRNIKLCSGYFSQTGSHLSNIKTEYGFSIIENKSTIAFDYIYEEKVPKLCYYLNSYGADNQYEVVLVPQGYRNKWLIQPEYKTTEKIKYEPFTVEGKVLGHCICNDYVVLFTKKDNTDYIILVNFNSEGYLEKKVLYSNNLTFSLEHPIETLFNYESENVQKVYWVDGKNRPRVINIKGRIQENNDSQFDFNPVATTPEVTIKKSYNGAGLFPSGTIQYVITYYNNFMQESAPVYVSPLQYLSDIDKGASTEDDVSCSFNIEISNLDPNWDNIRVYSIRRSSLDGTALGYLVAEEPLVVEDEDSIITIVDNGTNQEAIDATNFLFNNDDFVPSTLARKADRLFFGDIQTFEHASIPEGLETQIKENSKIDFYHKVNKEPYDYSSLYYYDSQLKKSEEEIKGFKGGECYRFALQFQNNRGVWGEPIHIKDIINPLYPKDTAIPKVKFELSLTEDIKSFITSNDIKNVRVLRADTSNQNRLVVSQGIISPTLYNMLERNSEYVHNINSWTQRFTNQEYHLQNVDYKNGTPNVYYNFEIPKEGDLQAVDKWDLKESIEEIDEDSSLDNTVYSAYLEAVNANFTYNCDNSITQICIDSLDCKIEIFNESGESIDSLIFNIKGKVGIPVRDAYLMCYRLTKKGKKDSFIKAFNTFYDAASAYFAVKTYNEIMHYGGDDISSTVSTSSIYDSLLRKIQETYPSITRIINIQEKEDKINYIDPNITIPVPKDKLLSAILEFRKNNTNTIFDEILSKKEYTKVIIPVDKVVKSIYEIKNNPIKNNYMIDATTLSYYSPDMNLSDYQGLNFRIVGVAPLNNNISSYTLSVKEDTQKGATTSFGLNSFSRDEGTYLYSYYLWYSSNIKNAENFGSGFPLIGLWCQSGSLNNGEEDILKHKVIGNLWNCKNTLYYNNDNKVNWEGKGIKEIKYYESNTINLGNKIYKGSYENTLLPSNADGFRFNYVEKESSSSKEILNDEKITSIKSSAYNSCLIKYSSLPHLVFSLNKDSNGLPIVLPGYIGGDYPNFRRPVTISSEESFYGKSLESNEKCYAYPFYERLPKIGYPTNNKLYYKNGQYESKAKIPPIIGAKAIVITYDYDLFEANTVAHNPLGVTAWNTFKTVLDYGNILPNNDGFSYNPLTSFLQYLFDSVKGYKLVQITGFDDEYLYYSDIINASSNDSSDFVDKLKNNRYDVVGGNIASLPNAMKYKTGVDGEIQIVDYGGFDVPVCSNHNIPFVKLFSDISTSSEDLNTLIDGNRCVLIGEFYKNSEFANMYGGDSPTAIKNTKYVQCSNVFKVDVENDIVIDDIYGDTYYQRWDCLRTYPTTEEDINSVVDVVSVMIESYTNLDGRYDSNRGRLDVHNSRPTNMNLINNAYSQTNNFFTIYDLDDRLKNSNFKNCYTWSLGKKNSELVDNWTKGLMVNVNPVDGAKGKITKLKLWKDYLLVFQEKGIARIHYNDQTTIGSLEGIPIEILNSSKVSGHNYLSETTGCPNKWSMATSEAGIYFVDNHNSINLFNGNVNSLSYTKSFKDWSLNNLNNTVWNPTNNGYYGSYDHLHHDYYITNTDNCLCYSEELQAFTSFYDYTKSPIMFNLENKFIGLESNNGTTKLWSQFEGDDYCNFYGEQKDYSVEYNVNPEPLNDKVFTNLEYRAYVDNSDDTFDKLEVSNEYQHGESIPNRRIRHIYPNAEIKFRIWRTDIPRDTNSRRSLDRIRSPWMKLKLTKNTNTNNKMNFHDLLVKYYE